MNQETWEICNNYHWPGNVRELENTIENACVMSDGEIIEKNDLPFYLLTNEKSKLSGNENEFEIKGADYTLKIEHAEKIIIEQSLLDAGGNRTKAAKNLGISIRTMRYKVKKYGL